MYVHTQAWMPPNAWICSYIEGTFEARVSYLNIRALMTVVRETTMLFQARDISQFDVSMFDE